MPFVAEASNEIAVYNAKWQALLDHVHAGIPLHEKVQEAIDGWGRKPRTEKMLDQKRETDPEKRFAQVQERVAALSKHFTPIIEEVSEWFAALKPLLTKCQAHLDGLPLHSAVNEVHAVFARAENRRLPDKPPIDLNDAASLERRARWLRDVAEVMQRVESGPMEISMALCGLHAVLGQFNQALERAKTNSRLTNTQALRWMPPNHPFVGAFTPKHPPPAGHNRYADLLSEVGGAQW
jgi:hypothetical protein